MTNFSPSKFLSELYNEHYLTYLTDNPNAPDYEYTNEWAFEETVHVFAQTQLAFHGDDNTKIENVRKHYELLRLIIYECCKYYRYNGKNYIHFIKDILFIILEQQSISLAHNVDSHIDPKLYSLLSKPQLSDIFTDKSDGIIKISNTSVHILLSKINRDICRVIEEHIAPRGLKRHAYFDDSQTILPDQSILPDQPILPVQPILPRSFKRYKRYKRTGGKKTKRRRSKKSKNIKKTKKYKKTKKFNKSKKTKKSKK